jgi:hypothetical protein
MWEHDNQTPFAADHSWVRDRSGAEVWLVAVKATFLIRPDGSTVIASEQVPVLQAPQFRDDPNKSSLLYDSDMYFTKPTTDVLLNGCAYAPGGQPTKRVDVTMRVGDVCKTLRVTGDRAYQDGFVGVSPGPVQPFTRMPITYERAYGGREPDPPANPERPQFEARNPVGTGFAPNSRKLAPNIEYPGRSQGNKPAGLGPIPAHWQPRVKYAGTYDEAWRNERLPLYAEDLDDRFFLCSPEDQQAREYLRGGEPVKLENLTSDGTLGFTLPRVALGFATEFSTGEIVLHRAKLHTVILEPDIPRLLMVWHTHLPCHPKVLKLERTTITQKKVLRSAGGASLDDDD